MIENNKVFINNNLPTIHGFTIWFPFHKLLGDEIISSKIDIHNRGKKEKRSYGKIKNNKTMLKSWHLLEFFILNNKALLCYAFLG